MIKCMFSQLKNPCREANKFFIGRANDANACCDDCYCDLFEWSKTREITREQYLNYQVLK